MDINEMADKVMAILRKLEEDTKAATREGGAIILLSRTTANTEPAGCKTLSKGLNLLAYKMAYRKRLYF